MSERFASMLRGGHHNSLGRAEEVVGIVLAGRARLDELFACLANGDELVRMRAGDALEKVCRDRPEWFVPHVERLLGEVGSFEQPSVQWHVAQILQHVRPALTDDQARRATELLRRNLTQSTDWIVLNVTMDVLAQWAQGDPALSVWLAGELEWLRHDGRRSVAKRATKHLAELTN